MTQHPPITHVSLTAEGLLVDGQPFIVIGGELHNSSSSSVAAIDEAFAHARRLGVNTVLAPVSWAQFEPSEGVFEHRLVDAMIRSAGEHDLRLIPLWFGSWKNGMSSYTPDWVKQDPSRFERAVTQRGGVIEHLSPFGAESREADARAFRALLARIAEVDAHGRVILVQVQNEVGLLGDSCDRSAAAEAAWSRPVPLAVIDAIASSEGTPVHAAWREQGERREGSWPEVLGATAVAEEAFMAWGYATYVDAVAAAGRSAHPLPLFSNVWLDSEIELDLPPEMMPDLAVAGGMQPGIYPSGGAVLRVAAIWAACAPHLDLVAPDVYFGDFDAIFSGYRSRFGHLLIPEMRTSPVGVSHMFRAIGEHRAIGVSPFGIDSIPEGSDEEAALQDAYRLLSAAATSLREHPGAAVHGFMLDEATPSAQFDFAGYRVDIVTQDPYGFTAPVYPAYGLVVEEEPGRFLVVGRGFSMSVSAAGEGIAGILSVTELEHAPGWPVVRELNGDESGSGSHARLPALSAAPSLFFPVRSFDRSSAILRVRAYTV